MELTDIRAKSAVYFGGNTRIIDFAPLTDALKRAKMLWHDTEAWRHLPYNGMSADVSWRRPAKQYADLYRSFLLI